MERGDTALLYSCRTTVFLYMRAHLQPKLGSTSRIAVRCKLFEL